MICPHCSAEFTPTPWPATHQTYCSRRCMKQAYYQRHRVRLGVKTRDWCQRNRATRLAVQRRWNASTSAKRRKKAWYQQNYQRMYAALKARGGVKIITARGTSLRRLKRHQPDRQCVCAPPHKGRIECHHRDGNPFNTQLENLEWRCTSHHVQVHQAMRGDHT